MNIIKDNRNIGLKSIFQLSLVVVLIVMLYIISKKDKKPAYQVNYEKCLYVKMQERKGVVEDMFWGRVSFKTKFKNGKVYSWINMNKISRVVEVGDSIYKPANSFNVFIYKRSCLDSVVLIENYFDCKEMLPPLPQVKIY